MMENFFTKTKEEIIALFEDFLEKDFYLQFPLLKENASIIITGSIATNNYDKYSDIDVTIILEDKRQSEELLPQVKEYKKHLKYIGVPIQVHKPTTYEQLESKLSGWQDDSLLRDCSSALIVSDPENRFLKLQEKFTYYPDDIYRDKITWLFAETIFQTKERFCVAVARNDIYFCEVVKVEIIRLYLNTILLLYKKWPAFDKHLYQEVTKIATKEDMTVIDTLLREQNIEKIKVLLEQLKIQTEEQLLENNLIKKETEEYWLNVRTKYQITLS